MKLFNKKSLIGILIFSLVLITSFPISASAAQKMHSSGPTFFFQYGPSGGLAFSGSASVKSNITYSQSGTLFNFTNSDSSISTDTGYGIGQCGSSMAVRPSTKFGGSTVSLNNTSSYVVGSNTTIVGKNSGSSWATSKNGSFSLNIQNEGYIQPAPSKCFGGATIQDSFNWSN